MKTLIKKKYNYQKRDNSKSIERINYEERTDQALKDKQIKEKYQGLMNRDFSMAKDFQALDQTIDRIGNLSRCSSTPHVINQTLKKTIQNNREGGHPSKMSNVLKNSASATPSPEKKVQFEVGQFNQAFIKRFNLKTKEGKKEYLKAVYLKGDHGVNFFEKKTRSIL